MNRKESEKDDINEQVDYLVEMLKSGHFMALSKLRRTEYPYSKAENVTLIRSLIMPRSLTSDRLKDAVIRWWMDIKTDSEILLQDEADKLVESLKDSVVEIAREAYERGKKGEVF